MSYFSSALKPCASNVVSIVIQAVRMTTSSRSKNGLASSTMIHCQLSIITIAMVSCERSTVFHHQNLSLKMWKELLLTTMPNKPIPCLIFITNTQFIITEFWYLDWESDTSEKTTEIYIIPMVMAICTQLWTVALNKEKNQVKM